MIKGLNKIIIFGCGGHSRSILDVLLDNDENIDLAFADPNAEKDEKINGFSVFKKYEICCEKIFFAIGDNAKRDELYRSYQNENIISIVSNRAYLSKTSKIGRGCFIGNHCHIGPEADVGANTIINTAAVVEHEVVIGKSCHIGPNATISGRCKIGDLVFIGVGATVKDSVSICSGVTVGAGGVVVKDIVEPGTYIGCPARRIK